MAAAIPGTTCKLVARRTIAEVQTGNIDTESFYLTRHSGLPGTSEMVLGACRRMECLA